MTVMSFDTTADSAARSMRPVPVILAEVRR
jgi:hypothetical protein